MPVLAGGVQTVLPTTTAKGIIKRAYRLIKVLAAGEEISPELLEDGREALNDMLDSWNTEKLSIPSYRRLTASLTAGDGSYTIGPSGDFQTARPDKIESAAIISAGQTAEHEIDVYTFTQYAAVSDKSTTGTPYAVYLDGAVPNRNLTVISPPTNADTLVLYAWNVLTQVSEGPGLLEALSLKPGYARALKYNLAVELAGEGGKLSAEVIAGAIESKANIKRMNMVPLEMKCDSALLGTSGGRFDILTGEIR